MQPLLVFSTSSLVVDDELFAAVEASDDAILVDCDMPFDFFWSWVDCY